MENEIPAVNIIAVGCPGTNVDIERKGVTRYLKKFPQKPVQWFECQLHAKELSLRHLMQYLEVTTSGTRSFSGIIDTTLAY